MPPIQAVSLPLAVAIISDILRLKLVWNSIEPKLPLRFLLPAFIGTHYLLIGLVGGTLVGIAGWSEALPTMWLSLRD